MTTEQLCRSHKRKGCFEPLCTPYVRTDNFVRAWEQLSCQRTSPRLAAFDTPETFGAAKLNLQSRFVTRHVVPTYTLAFP